jgi:hypothetical protein
VACQVCGDGVLQGDRDRAVPMAPAMRWMALSALVARGVSANTEDAVPGRRR